MNISKIHQNQTVGQRLSFPQLNTARHQNPLAQRERAGVRGINYEGYYKCRGMLAIPEVKHRARNKYSLFQPKTHQQINKKGNFQIHTCKEREREREYVMKQLRFEL